LRTFGPLEHTTIVSDLSGTFGAKDLHRDHRAEELFKTSAAEAAGVLMRENRNGYVRKQRIPSFVT
jgi:hypothetical protein